MIVASSKVDIKAGVQRFGVAPGALVLIQNEEEAYAQAAVTGQYVTWRSADGRECARVGPNSKCFCGHPYATHKFTSAKSLYPSCKGCACKSFAFIPHRPEEVGEWWLPRRKGFNVHSWRAQCRCGHGHDAHNPGNSSAFMCVVCDKHWEEHETVFETEAERRAAGRPTGEAFRPLAADPDVRELVFCDAQGAEAAKVREGAVAVGKARPATVQEIRAAVRPPAGAQRGALDPVGPGSAVRTSSTSRQGHSIGRERAIQLKPARVPLKGDLAMAVGATTGVSRGDRVVQTVKRQ